MALAAFPDGTEVWAEGAVEGTIAPEGRGDGGFGYDPVFVPAEGGDGRTFAEMTAGRRGPCRTGGGPSVLLAQRLCAERRHGAERPASG